MASDRAGVEAQLCGATRPTALKSTFLFQNREELHLFGGLALLVE